MDRIDRDFMLEESKRQREERQADVAAAGPLLDERQTAELRQFLEQQCWMKPQQARDVIETISALAGEAGANPRSVVKDALEGHVSQKFLANDANFTGIIRMIAEAISGLNERIAGRTTAPEEPALSTPPLKPPGI